VAGTVAGHDKKVGHVYPNQIQLDIAKKDSAPLSKSQRAGRHWNSEGLRPR
jgi:hypothetical protein